MSRRNRTLDQTLDEAVARMRAQHADPEQVARAADRVWERLAHDTASTAGAVDAGAVAGNIDGCAGFQALIPAYLAGELSPERRLLLEDHSRECLPCRRALKSAREGIRPAAETATPRRAKATGAARPWRRLLPLAAAVILAVGLLGGYLVLNPGGDPSTVQSVTGTLLKVADSGTMTPLAPGDRIDPRQAVRTAKGSAAVVRLADGSLVELRERTEMAVSRRLRGTTIQLDRGNIIVEAAKQHGGHLYVATDDCRVSVTGTIFAVNHGVKGSRVSVVEGEVRVDRGQGAESILHPGDQVTTGNSLEAVPVYQEVAWSRNHDRYAELLRELDALQRALDERVERPGLRYATRLAPAVPADAVAFAAMPNLGGQVADGYAVFRDQLATSPLLAEWWAANGAESEAQIERVITALHDLGSYLGDEVALTVLPGEGDASGGPTLLAETVRPGIEAFLAAEADRLATEAGHEVLRVVADPADAGGDADLLWVWTGDGLLVASPEPAALAAVAAAAAGSAPALPGTPLYERIEEAYGDGVEWLFVGDVGAAVHPEGDNADEAAALDRLGIADTRYLVVEHRSEGERGVTSAELSFAGPRHGIASWLGAPAPMGSLEFVSPQAAMAFAAVTKDPAAMLADVLELASQDDADAASHLASHAEDLDIVRELAASLGGEVAFAVDGPLLPQPSWKLVVEVYDADRLQAAIADLVARIAIEAEEHGETAPLLTAETAGGRTVYRFTGPGGHGEAFYLYADGYLVAAPSTALLLRSLDQRASGATLQASAELRALLPSDGRANFSGLFYQNLGTALAPIADQIAGLAGGAGDDSEGGGMSVSQARALADLAADAGPTLGYAYGESDRITIAATGPRGPLGLGYRALLGLSGLEALGDRAGAEAH